MVIKMPKWIKSQDRNALIEAKGIIDVGSVKKCHNKWLIWCEDLWLGTYPTKDRALEVLQMIEGFLTFETTRVFVMPKE